MSAPAVPQAPTGHSTWQVRFLDANAPPLSAADRRRLFPGEPARRKLGRPAWEGSRAIVESGDRIVGFAAWAPIEGTFRVHLFGVDRSAALSASAIANALLEAVELACVAAAGRAIVFLPLPGDLGPVLDARGYVEGRNGYGAPWREKRFQLRPGA